jgi:hypothetical protein
VNTTSNVKSSAKFNAKAERKAIIAKRITENTNKAKANVKASGKLETKKLVKVEDTLSEQRISIAREAILAGKSNAEVTALLVKTVPGFMEKTRTPTLFAGWYRRQMVKQGLVKADFAAKHARNAAPTTEF